MRRFFVEAGLAHAEFCRRVLSNHFLPPAICYVTEIEVYLLIGETIKFYAVSFRLASFNSADPYGRSNERAFTECLGVSTVFPFGEVVGVH